MKALARALVLLGAVVSITVSAQNQNPAMPPRPEMPHRSAASIRVQVFAANGTFLPTQALVRLHDPRQMHQAWDTTHDRSETIFYRLAPGTYEVEVSAPGYQTAVTHVTVYDEPVQYTVQVTLKADTGDVYHSPAGNPIPRKARKESQRGLDAMQKGNWKDAEKHLHKALAAAPQNAQINFLLGLVLLRARDVQQAGQFFMQAISLDPHHAPALTALGGLRLEQQDVPAAIKFLTQAIAANPKQWRAHWLLANARLMQNDNNDAKTEAELAIKLSDDSAPGARLVLGEALGNLGEYGAAIATLQKFLQQAPTSSDAPSAQKMIREMQETMQAGETPPPPVALSAVTAAPLPMAPMLSLMSPLWGPPDVDAVLPPVAAGVSCPMTTVLSNAGAHVKELVDAVDSFSATEVQTHEELDPFGNPLSRDTRKSDYVAALSQAQNRPRLQEFRRDLSGLGAFPDRIPVSSLLGLAFVFHPAMQQDYSFDCEGLGQWNGEPAWLVHFRGQAPATLHTGAKSQAVALRGRAWIGAKNFQIVHIEADLDKAIPEMSLLSEHEFADYAPVSFEAKKLELWLPEDAQIYLDFRGHDYRVSDHYTGFKLNSADTREKVDLHGSRP